MARNGKTVEVLNTDAEGRLALSLAKLGHDRNSIENQLIAWRFHPSVCYETLNWMDTTSFELPGEETFGEDA